MLIFYEGKKIETFKKALYIKRKLTKIELVTNNDTMKTSFKLDKGYTIVCSVVKANGGGR